MKGGALEQPIHPKTAEYVGRINAGENPQKVTEGLPEKLRQDVLSRISAETDHIRKGELERELGIASNEGGESEIRNVYAKVYYANRTTLSDDMFIVGKGMLPDGETPYKKVDRDVGKHYQGHGISKTGQLDFLLNLLKNGIDKGRPFFTAPFAVPVDEAAMLGSGLGTSGGEPYKDGLAVVVGEKDQHLEEGGIKYVFINDVFGDIVPVLQKQFPQYEFYKLSQQAEVLK